MHRQNLRYNELTSEDTITTVCHVFDSHNPRGATYYHYIYKVGDDFYTCSASGVKTTSFHREPIQSFLLVFNENQPGHHTILRSQKVDNLLEIGTILENPGNLDSIIKKNTTLMTTAVPIASKNNINDMLKYRNKSRL
jgi:hypothetical protein